MLEYGLSIVFLLLLVYPIKMTMLVKAIELAIIVYVSFKKVKRGYYHFESSLLAEPGMHTKKGELTLLYKNKLEQTIKEDPANYLWSHRRFKYEYKEEYGGIIE